MVLTNITKTIYLHIVAGKYRANMVSLLVFVIPDQRAPRVLLFAPSSASNCSPGKLNYCEESVLCINAKGRKHGANLYPQFCLLLLNITSEVDGEHLILPTNAAATVRLHPKYNLLPVHHGCHGSGYLHFDFEVV